MVGRSLGACSHGAASIFNISQPHICSGALIPYSCSHRGFFIYELSNMLPAKRPNLRPPSGSRGTDRSIEVDLLQVVTRWLKQAESKVWLLEFKKKKSRESDQSPGDLVTLTKKAN